MKEHNQRFIENSVKKLAWDNLRKNIVVDDNMMIDKRTCEVLSQRNVLNQVYCIFGL